MSAFFNDDLVTSHVQRRRQILAAHPEAIHLQGADPLTIWAILGLVATQFITAWLVADSAWWIVLLAAYFWGAIWAHALYVMLHEACHNLVFKGSFGNRVAGVICDLPLIFPSAMAFRHYHMIHHRYIGHSDHDPDVCSEQEARLVGNQWWRKLLWISFFSVSQGLRPLKLAASMRKIDAWMKINVLVCLIIAVAVYYFIAPAAFWYLLLSTFFALGLHPLGGRWIQEHYTLDPKQETYSYYGPLNWLSFNIGYHNEHHDLMNVSWRNLPKLKSMAPEFYEPLTAHQSWIKVLTDFIFKKEYSAYSRVVRR